MTHDGSPEVLAAFAAFGVRTSGKPCGVKKAANKIYGQFGTGIPITGFGDSVSAARFFFCAKADQTDRMDTRHPTTKSTALISWLAKLITPPGGHILDPFAGSGTLGVVALKEGFRATLIEQDATHIIDIRQRLTHVRGNDTPLFAATKAEDRQSDMFAETG
jgi:site-specific DNA-methyltransferase (adenine-specific)